jgi:hypothetical protein
MHGPAVWRADQSHRAGPVNSAFLPGVAACWPHATPLIICRQDGQVCERVQPVSWDLDPSELKGLLADSRSSATSCGTTCTRCVLGCLLGRGLEVGGGLLATQATTRKNAVTRSTTTTTPHHGVYLPSPSVFGSASPVGIPVGCLSDRRISAKP